jgi:hypothetical protein
MINIKVSDCRSCPFVEFSEVTGYDGCSQSDEITQMYISKGNMPEIGVHELCPIRNEKSVIVELSSTCH